MQHTPSTIRHFPRFARSWLVAGVLGANLLSAPARAGDNSALPAPTAPASGAAPVEAGQSTPATPTPGATTPPSPSATPPAATEEQKQAARASIEQGRAAYNSGDYATAEAHFKQAKTLANPVEAQFWLAMSLDLQGKTAAAVEAFEALMAHAKLPELAPEHKQTATQRLQVLQQIPAAVNITVTPANAALTIDGQPQPGTSPYALRLAEGVHHLSLQADGFEPLAFELSTRPAQALEQSYTLNPVPPPPAPTPEPAATPVAPTVPPPPPSKVPAYVTLGVAGASAIVGTIFGIQALSAKDDFDNVHSAANADDVERNALVADMAFGVALTLGITGVVLLTTDEPQNEASRSPTLHAKPKLQVAPYVSARGAGAAARMAF